MVTLKSRVGRFVTFIMPKLARGVFRGRSKTISRRSNSPNSCSMTIKFLERSTIGQPYSNTPIVRDRRNFLMINKNNIKNHSLMTLESSFDGMNTFVILNLLNIKLPKKNLSKYSSTQYHYFIFVS